MYWQREYLRENTTMVRGETWRQDLPQHGLLGSLLLRMNVAGVSGAFAATEKWRILDFLSKIEVIGDGSTIIKSLTGELVNALIFYDQGLTNLDYWHSYATGTKWCHLLINFGRRLFDTEMGLDLSRFNNVELQITNDASSTYFGADIGLSVLQYFLRDTPGSPFRGYMATEEWRNWTTVADETKYLELPTSYPLRRLIMQCIPDVDAYNLSETGMWNVADNVLFALKTGALRVFDGGIDDLMWENAWDFGRELFSSPNLYMTADYGRRTSVGYVLMATAGAGTQDGAVASAVPTLEGRRTDNTQKPENYEADTLQSLTVRGICPENTVVFRFDKPDDPTSYLNIQANQAVKLDVHTRNASSAADGTIRVVLDRYVS
jgi:hypothetical protein